MADEIKSVNGVNISALRKIGLYVFGKQKYIDVKQRGGELKMLVEDSTNDEEIKRFEDYWKITVLKVK